MSNEADTCRKYVLPKLAPWDREPHRLSKLVYFTDGRIVVVGRKGRRRRQGKRADYILRHRAEAAFGVVHPLSHIAAKDEREPARGQSPPRFTTGAVGLMADERLGLPAGLRGRRALLLTTDPARMHGNLWTQTPQLYLAFRSSARSLRGTQ